MGNKKNKGKIDTVFFDVGGTLRYVETDKKSSDDAVKELYALLGELGVTQPAEELFVWLEARWKENRKMARQEMLDVSEVELWTKYLLPECPQDDVAANAARLTTLWRARKGWRVTSSGAKETLKKLHKRGYKLGIISNTVTENEIPDWLRAEGMIKYFQTVLLSAKVRLRKPDPLIYSLAARCIHSPIESCAFVGDKLLEDVQAPKDSGFGAAVLYTGKGSCGPKKGKDGAKPDYSVEKLTELLDVFKPL